YTIYIQSSFNSGIIIYNALDLTTLLINAVGIKFCEGRYKQLYGNGTLNARYQVKEAYLLAKAMHPVYLGSFVIKICSALIAYTYIFLLDYFDAKIFALIETVYFLVHAFNCTFSSTFLMIKHKSLRRAVRKLFRVKKRKPRRDSLSTVAYTKEECSVTYFNMLDSSWQ
ncbi:hypothetical protein PENTCL1PPCAC_14242, partial [Pristionchus entomophagus]